jgi:deoxyhypusine synthase
MERACSEAGMKVVHRHEEVFDFDQEDTPPGFTGVCLLDASHATSHCYSITGQIALDVFTCGQVCPKAILDRIIVDLKREVASGLQVTHQGTQSRFRDATATGVRGFMDRNYKHFNAAALLEASKGYEEHIDQGGKMLLTLAGAMSTAELGVSVAELIRQDKVHALCVTGANLEEDVFNLVAHNHYTRIPHWRHLTPEDDEKLRDQGLNRVTDTCIPEDTAVRRLEDLLLKEYKQACDRGQSLLPSEFFKRLLLNGDLEQFYQADPQDSWLLAAAEKNIPVFTPGWEDSTCGNIIVANLLEGKIPHSPVKSGLDQMGDLVRWYLKTNVDEGHKIGFFQVGGGIAGDFPICAVPLIKQDLQRECDYWSYFAQISEATTSYGGYSGAPPTEKISWGKLTPQAPMYMIESDATICFPLLANYVLRK